MGPTPKSEKSKNIKYVYDLPYSERSEICNILNQNDKWEELAGKSHIST